MTTNAPTVEASPKRRRGVIRALILLVPFYAALCVSGCVLQRRLIYYPTKLDENSAQRAAAQQGFRPWRNSSGRFIGWNLHANQSPTCSVLVVHGNGGCALDRGYIARPIHDAGPIDVYILEYPGYGPRGGSPNMASFLAAGEEAFDALPENLPKYVVSESLGTGVSAHIAKKHPTEVSGLLMFAPYSNLASVAQSKFPFLPVYLLLSDRYNPAEWLKGYRGPAKMVLAERDEVIPTKIGRRLYESYTGPKTLQVIPGAHHNDIPAQASEWWRETLAFWRTNG